MTRTHFLWLQEYGDLDRQCQNATTKKRLKSTDILHLSWKTISSSSTSVVRPWQTPTYCITHLQSIPEEHLFQVPWEQYIWEVTLPAWRNKHKRVQEETHQAIPIFESSPQAFFDSSDNILQLAKRHIDKVFMVLSSLGIFSYLFLTNYRDTMIRMTYGWLTHPANYAEMAPSVPKTWITFQLAMMMLKTHQQPLLLVLGEGSFGGITKDLPISLKRPLDRALKRIHPDPRQR